VLLLDLGSTRCTLFGSASGLAGLKELPLKL